MEIKINVSLIEFSAIRPIKLKEFPALPKHFLPLFPSILVLYKS